MRSSALVLLAALPALAAEPDPGLLRKLAEHAARLGADRPAGLETTVEELDSDGKPEKSYREVRKRNQDQLELVSATQDGEDVLEKAREREAKAKQGKADEQVGISLPSPFEASQQPLYAFTAEPLDPEGRQVRIEFRPRGKKSERISVGEAVVDPRTGELVSMALRPSENPRFVDHMLIELSLAAGSTGRRLETIAARADGGFLFFRKRIRTLTRLSY